MNLLVLADCLFFSLYWLSSIWFLIYLVFDFLGFAIIVGKIIFLVGCALNERCLNSWMIYKYQFFWLKPPQCQQLIPLYCLVYHLF